MRLILSALIMCLTLPAMQMSSVHAKETKPPITVVELFTSQGCSSCPPADAILADLARHDHIIALGCHVSYWDRGRWRDKLSQKFCDIRQHGYIGMKGETRFYTPQMVVNGQDAFVGSRKKEVKKALDNAKNSVIAPIDIEYEGTTIRFTLPSITMNAHRLWAFGYKNPVRHNIGGGENSGRAVTYANPVLSYINLGSWQGRAAIHEFDRPDADIDGIVVIAQKNGYGDIVAAGKLAF